MALAILCLTSAPALGAPVAPNPTSLGFAKEAVGGTSPSQTVLVSNPSPGVVQISGVSVLGTDPGDFPIVADNCAGAALDQGETCPVEIAFSPQAGGPRDAALEIAIEGEAAIDVPLAGTGQTMLLTVPGSTSFPITSVGGASTMKIPLKNESESGVNVNEVKIEGVDPGDFGIEGNDCLGYIGVGMGCELSVRFSPGASGPREARLHVSTDATPSDYFTALEGEGAAPELTFEPTSHDFGLVEMHSGGPRTNFTLRNTGTASVQLSNLEISGPDANEFWIPGSDCWGTTLLPGATCQVEVQFNANEEGSFTAAVRVAAGSATFAAPLTARAARPRVEASPAPLAFGPVSVGSRQVREVTVTNTGELPVGFYIAIVSGGDVGSFHLLEEDCTSNVFAGSPRIFEPGESCVAKVAFEPTDVGAVAATISFFGGGEGAFQVPIEGDGVAPRLSLSPGSRDFGTVVVGDAGPVQTFQLRNESGEAQAIDSATLTGPDLGEFQVRSDECTEAVLDPGASCAVAVRFHPESSGAQTAALRLRGAGGTTVAELRGEGTAPVLAAAAANAAAKHGRVVLALRPHPQPAAGKVRLGRARCQSSGPCVVSLSGLAVGPLATASGLRPGVRPLGPSQVRLPAGASIALTVALPPELRASAGVVRLRIALHWRTGPDRGDSSHGILLSSAPGG